MQKFDPDFIPDVRIDKNSAMKRSLESILTSLERVTDHKSAQGECVLGVQLDTRKENSCNSSNEKLGQEETSDSGIVIITCNSKMSTSNSQDTSVTSFNEDASGVIEYSSSASGLRECEDQCMQESQEYTGETSILEHPSGANINIPSCSANSLGRTFSSSGGDYVTESGTSPACIVSCSLEQQHNIIMQNAWNLSFPLDMALVLTLPDVTTYDHSIEHNTSTQDAATQVTNVCVRPVTEFGQNLDCELHISRMNTIDESQNYVPHQLHPEEGTQRVTDVTLSHMSDTHGSILSLFFDTEHSITTTQDIDMSL